jgi:hypothetical protein
MYVKSRPVASRMAPVRYWPSAPEMTATAEVAPYSSAAYR